MVALTECNMEDDKLEPRTPLRKASTDMGRMTSMSAVREVSAISLLHPPARDASCRSLCRNTVESVTHRVEKSMNKAEGFTHRAGFQMEPLPTVTGFLNAVISNNDTTEATEEDDNSNGEIELPLLDGSVTAATSVINVSPGSYAQFSRWVTKGARLQMGFDGFLGFDSIPGEKTNEFMLIIRYLTSEQLWLWINSIERHEWIDEARSFANETKSLRFHTSKFFSFQQPHEQASLPNYHKMALVTFLVIWPLVHFIIPGLAPLISNPWAHEIIGTFFVVLTAHYIGIPGMTQLLSCWVFPQNKKVEKKRPPRRLKNIDVDVV